MWSKRGRWKRWLFLVLGLLLVLVVIGWFFAGREAGRRVQQQLAELGLGQVQAGKSSVTFSGVATNDIRFTREGENEPWLVVGKLQIEEPLSQLATGSEEYDQITFADVKLLLDADELIPLASADESTGFDISGLELPSKNIVLQDASVRVIQKGRNDLVIDNIDAELLEEDFKTFQIAASIEGWLNAHWNLSGAIRASRNEVDLFANAKEFQLPKDWQKLPGMPANLDQYVHASGTADLDASILVRGKKPIQYRAELTPLKTALRLPAFDLDLSVFDGQAVVADGNIQLRQVVATGDEREKIVVDGSGNIDSFPVEFNFDADFEELSVGTVRKFVPDIPDQVTGRASVGGWGSVSVSKELETSLLLKATAQSRDAVYGKLQAGSSQTRVELDSMKLASDLSLIDLQGRVIVNAHPKKQSADDIFETFRLPGLQQQLNMQGLFDAQMDLEIPLATAGMLETWALAIEAESDSGSLDGQPVKQIRANVRLDEGNLIFAPMTALAPNKVTPEPEVQLLDGGQISLNLDWPITENARHADHGKLELSARRLPTKWAVALGQSQIQTASESSGTNGGAQETALSNRATVKRKNAQPWIDPALVSGWLNLDAEVRIDAAQPDNLKLWQLQGTLADSVVATEVEQLNQLKAQIELNDGQLKIQGLDGQLQKGSTVQGEAKLDVMTGELSAASLRSTALPFAWALEMARLVSPEARSYFKSLGIRPAGEDRNVDGRLAVEVGLQENDQAADGWQFDFQLESKRLMAAQQVVDSLQLVGSVNDQQVQVKQFSAQPGIADADGLIRAAGDLDATGMWRFSDQQGRGSLKWSRTPVSWVVGLLRSQDLPVLGTTSGSIDVVSTDREQDFPAQVEGVVSFDRVGLGNRFRTSSRLQIETDLDANQLLVRSNSPAGNSNGFDFNTTVSLKTPYEYSGSTKFKSLSLKRLNDLSDPAERMLLSSNPEKVQPLQIDGAMTGDVDFAGQIQPWTWQTRGQITVSDPLVEGQKLTDVDANWNVDNRDFSSSVANFQVLGGQIKVVETVANPKRIGVSIEKLNASELSALAGSSFPVLEGQLSGDASINDWDVADQCWADLRLQGASSRVVGVRLSNLGAEAEYRKRTLKYQVSGRALNGSIAGDGVAEFGGQQRETIELPLEVIVDGAELQGLAFESNRYQSLKPLRGALSAKMQLSYHLQDGFGGNGKVSLASVGWRNELLSRVASSDVRIKSGIAELSNFQADLRRGKISGRVIVPLAGVATGSSLGSYQIDIQKFDLERLMNVAKLDSRSATGFVDARLSGKLGRTITGRGTVGFDRAKFYGVAADSLKVPVQFRFDPARLTGRVEVRQSTIRALHGRITGEAAMDFGRSMNVDVDLNLSRIDTADLLAAFDPLRNQGQGKLSGQLVLRGRSMTRSRDLKGSFTGSLDRAQAFRVPLLSDIANVVGGGRLGGSAYDSDQINIRLANNRISVLNLQLESSLASVSIGGDAYLDGRLDLGVVATVGNLGQPAGLDQLVRVPNPLAAVQLNPVAQVTDVLAGRNVFAQVKGTIARPVVRLDAGQQLRAEATRYFLRGRQILPNAGGSTE